MDRSDRRSVKAGIDKDDCRKNRTQQKVELRKAKKEEGLQKRRNMLADVNVEIEPPVTPEAASSTLAAQGAIVLGFVERNGPAEEFEDAFQATKHLRKQLSLARNPPIDDVIHAGLVPAFVTMLGHPDTKLQFEAAWCLTNIASGTSKQCEKVVNNNGVPALVGLLTSPSIDVSEQAVWAIGNIAGDCPAMRDLVLQNGASDKIVQLVEVRSPQGATCSRAPPLARTRSLRAHPPARMALHSRLRPACLLSPHMSPGRIVDTRRHSSGLAHARAHAAGHSLLGADGTAAERRVGAFEPRARQAAARDATCDTCPPGPR